MLSFNSVEYFIGQPFFYADYESGTGWESKIDHIFRSAQHNAYILELSCGTRVTIEYNYKSDNKAFRTNLKETNV